MSPLVPLRVSPAGLRRLVGAMLVLVAALVASPLVRSAVAEPSTPPPAPVPSAPWPSPVLETAATIPLQDGGRIMPLAQWARFTLLRLNHRDTVTDAAGRTRSALEWALDVAFRPLAVADVPTFLVETTEVLDAIDYRPPAGRKKRDRYSYLELVDSRSVLLDRAEPLRRQREQGRKLDPVEGGIVALASNVRTFERLASLFEGARFEVPVAQVEPLREALALGERTTVRASDVLGRIGELRFAGAPSSDPRVEKAARLLGALDDAFRDGRLLSVIPPTETLAQEEVWFTPADLFDRAMTRRSIDPAHLLDLRRLEDASAAAESGDLGAFERSLKAFAEGTKGRARTRGEGEKLGLEAFLVRFEPFHWAKLLYLVAFCLVAGTWLRRTRLLSIPAWTVLFAAIALHVTGIVLRSILRGRPPVVNLYDTTLFIGACAVIGAVVVEAVQRRRFGLALAPLIGVVLTFIAGRYETITADDTMAEPIAVLRTNFWLATHVTCISLGYTVTLLAAAIAHLPVISRVTGWRAADADFQRSVSKAVYGTLAFGLCLSTVGTILGGIWANDSWGRFWGWDPKENGALMIVLSQLAILHARLGGHLKPHGFALATIGAGCVVAFSWWGVNLLGIGLHSYGFASGVWTGLRTFWGIEALVIGAGLLVRRAPAAAPPAAASSPAA